MKRRKPRGGGGTVTTRTNERARKQSGGGGGSGSGGGVQNRQRKGLRHFAVRVSAKVESKIRTTYTQVADELVSEEKCGGTIDEKNVRRRVYDSLNVLIALGIIEKHADKSIRWRGRLHELREANEKRRAIIARKRAFLTGTREQAATLEALINRNRTSSIPSDGLKPPFLIIGTSPQTNIDCTLDKSQCDVQFTLSNDFTIFDDREVLRRIQLPSNPPPPPSPLVQMPSFAVAARLNDSLQPNSPRSLTSTPRRQTSNSLFQSPGSFLSTPKRYFLPPPPPPAPSSAQQPFHSPRSFSSLPLFSPRDALATGTSQASTPRRSILDLGRESACSSSDPQNTLQNSATTTTAAVATAAAAASQTVVRSSSSST